ncbi:MAG: ABC transporter ATP-binding protein [Thermodesulfobacteriota bacterium]
MLLEVSEVDAGYGAIQVLWGLSLHVLAEGEVVSVVGPNGAGKTTTLRSIMGLVRMTAGSIRFLGRDITGLPTHKIAQMGLALVPEGRNLFEGMTVLDNLLLGAYMVRSRAQVRNSLDFVFSLFPRLEERRSQLAGTLSGGERQMLAIARALMSRPKMLLLDEPSFGLAPKNVVLVFETVRKLSSEKLGVLLVEQNVHTALEVADRAYVVEQGRVVSEGRAVDLIRDDRIKRTYLGV